MTEQNTPARLDTITLIRDLVYVQGAIGQYNPTKGLTDIVDSVVEELLLRLAEEE